MEAIAYYDYFLLLPYILIFFLVARKLAKKNSDSSREFYWLLIGWWLKIIACILYAWMIVYYYGYGDPLGYKDRSDELMNSILKNWGNIKYLFLPAQSFKEDHLLNAGYSSQSYIGYLGYYNDPVFIISKVGCITGFFCFNRFLIISFIFTNLGYYGFIIIYSTFKKIVKGFNKQLAIACLFIPSCVFWSSGYAKEPLCIIALGFIFSCLIKLFSEKKFEVATILTLILFSYLLITVKNYIFFCFLIAFIIWKLYSGIKILLSRSLLIRIWMIFLFIIISVGFWRYSAIFTNLVSNNLGYIITSNIDIYESMASKERGSIIEIENLDVSSLGGILKFIPQGLVNVFFKPFPWEIANVLMVFTVLENFFFIFLLMNVLIKSRLFTKHLFISKNFQVLAFSFAILLAFVVGISTFNMGTMVRYKMPFLPFWAGFLLILNKKLSGNKGIVNL